MLSVLKYRTVTEGHWQKHQKQKFAFFKQLLDTVKKRKEPRYISKLQMRIWLDDADNRFNFPIKYLTEHLLFFRNVNLFTLKKIIFANFKITNNRSGSSFRLHSLFTIHRISSICIISPCGQAYETGINRINNRLQLFRQSERKR